MSPRPTGVLVSLAAFALLAGCGSDGNTTVQESPTASSSAAAPTTTAAAPHAKQLFATKCGNCHTLKAAGTTGTIGPNLDEEKPPRSEVLAMMKEGPESMPANLVSGKDAEAVASFVAANEGK
jgi:mono/diheme cytochrome c family protein